MFLFAILGSIAGVVHLPTRMSLEHRPSGLILAPKRSGTNFTHDILAPAFTSAVNEPLGLHNDTLGGKPSPLNPWRYSSLEHVSKKYGHVLLEDDPYGSLLARNLVGWLGEGGKLIKETDFLHLGWLLGSVPLRIVTIRRDPRESIASFRKHDLYEKWGFQDKVYQLADTILSNEQLRRLYGGFPQLKDIATLPMHQQLAIYYAIAVQEISRATQDYQKLEVNYEDLATNTVSTFQKIMTFFDLPWNDRITESIAKKTSSLLDPGTHGTFRRSEDLAPFSKYLTSEEEADIRAIFADFEIILPQPESVLAETTATTIIQAKDKKPLSVENVQRATEARAIKDDTVLVELDKPIYVSKKLVTNLQYARFLSWLLDNGIPLSINGKPIFYNDRPQGSIRRNQETILVENEHADHPVNFINWIGAAAYSAWVGGRLPSAQEWEEGICPDELALIRNDIDLDKDDSNIGQFYGDTTPVNFFPPNYKGIHDALGNVSIWINSQGIGNPFERMKAGLEWNHSRERGVFPNPRPYWLGTSGLGVRTVFSSLEKALPDDAYLDKIRDIIEFLTSHHRDPAEVNKALFLKFEELFASNE
ncbi:MAG: SUMF1/EgtB/PvdO family nonheme iron enzyme [Candidatus Levybacteria bacterium]|nr:SUMF1/EgtB/PvdO family nonheme iron enzyme [Candidatus Levybacteria bacterium]